MANSYYGVNTPYSGTAMPTMDELIAYYTQNPFTAPAQSTQAYGEPEMQADTPYVDGLQHIYGDFWRTPYYDLGGGEGGYYQAQLRDGKLDPATFAYGSGPMDESGNAGFAALAFPLAIYAAGAMLGAGAGEAGALAGGSGSGSLAGGAAADTLGAYGISPYSLAQPGLDVTLGGSTTTLGPSIGGGGLGSGIAATPATAASAYAPFATAGMGAIGAGLTGITPAALQAAASGLSTTGLGGAGGASGGLTGATTAAPGSSLWDSAKNALGGASGVGSLLGAGAGLLSSLTAPDSETTTQQRTVDPRVDAMLFGQGGQGGLLNMVMSELAKKPNAGTQGAWNIANSYFSPR